MRVCIAAFPVIFATTQGRAGRRCGRLRQRDRRPLPLELEHLEVPATTRSGSKGQAISSRRASSALPAPPPCRLHYAPDFAKLGAEIGVTFLFNRTVRVSSIAL